VQLGGANMPWQYATRAIWIVSLFVSSIHVAVAAEIIREARNPVDVIKLEGRIELEDAAQFQAAADASGKAIIVLDSEGGLLDAGLAMGALINQKHFATFVPPDTACLSSCALMWLAGNPRIIAAGGVVGFHAAYFEHDGSVSAQANAKIGYYLSALGFSLDVTDYVTHAMPLKMAYLNESTARRIGLAVIWGDQADEPSSQPPPGTRTSRRPYDPVSAVTVFYRALGAADGNTAAALIVPEKRGIGPFNELEMAKFFGNMREPLRLLSDPRPLARDLVRAEYRYVYKNGKVCNGKADVTTTYQFGNTFIQGIKANC
jgi:hypothetical protein